MENELGEQINIISKDEEANLDEILLWLNELFIEPATESTENLSKDKKPELSEDPKATDKAKIKKKSGDVRKICDICGAVTTYKDLQKHRKSDEHKLKLKQLGNKKKIAKENEIHQKRGEVDISVEDEHLIPSEDIKQPKDSEAKQIIEIYYPRWFGHRYGLSRLSERHQAYLFTLSTFLALRYSFDKNPKDFRLSVINSHWKDFGDVVIELLVDGKIDDIRAIHCKQIHNRNSISISGIGSDVGKFSLKARCNVLKKLRDKSNYDKTTFIFYTISYLTVDRDTFPNFTYDEEVVKTWNNDKEKKEWINSQIIIPEYRKTSLTNITDDPDHVCIFRILKSLDEELTSQEKKDQLAELMKLNNDLSKFCMLTNQAKLKDLTDLMKLFLEEKFGKCKDIAEDLTTYVGDYFKNILQKNETFIIYKLKRNSFLTKSAELLLIPYFTCPRRIIKEEKLNFWNTLTQIFDVIVVKNQSDIMEKIHAAINNILYKETKYFADCSELIIQNENVTDKNLNSELFVDQETQIQISLQDIHLKLWKIKLIPLILVADSESDLSVIVNVINVLGDNKVPLKFIIMTNAKVDRSCFSKDLKVFLNLKDLETDTTIRADFQQLLELRIKVLNISVSLKEITEYNTSFLQNNTPSDLLNMLLDDYTFKNINVPMTNDINENTLVLSDSAIEEIKRNFHKDEKPKKLSYVVSIKGKPVKIEVPPQL